MPNLSTLTIWYKDPQSGVLDLADSYFGVRNEAALLADRPRPEGMVRYAMTLQDPIWETEVNQNGRFVSKKFVETEGIRSTAVFPLRVQGKAVGVMFFSYRQPHIFTDEEKRLYPILAEVVAASIQDALLLSTSQRERERFELALDVTSTIGANLDQDRAIANVLARLQQADLFPNTTAAVLRYDEDEHSLVFTPSSLPFYFPENPDDPTITSVPINGTSIVASVSRRAMETRRKAFINEGSVKENADYMNIRPDTQSELAISLWSEEKGLIGVFVLESTQQHAFDDNDVQTASLLAKQIRFAIERAIERDDMVVNYTVAAATAWGTEIAHDIEQEIYHIRSIVEALRDWFDGSPPDKVESYLAIIDESAERLVTATPPESQHPESFFDR
ncbi:MAG: GAF domain-containing protein [Caldilineaceae bacterium]|nr:GAF domain-containing protein [Caldilineaceae bacterium]